ncbi:ATP-binding protein [Streptomyces sp. NPDC051636]|uniref:sensor histidine kinase n=1 Tax=Streptomyces sp. NPDC051636 TaxID=3365663 RepID=UPI003799484A
MSHLRAPAARADRREGGRHGRPVARPVPALPETRIRPQLMRLAVLPPVAVALSASAAVLVTVRSAGVRPGPTLWAVLAGSVSVTVAGILIAAVAADRAARSVSDRVGALRRSAARGEADLRALVEALRRGENPPPRGPRGGPAQDADDLELLAADLARAHDGAVTAVVQAAQLSSQAGSEQKLEVFVNLARRLQSLVHREISILDELENEIEDPDLLKGLFHVDHLATRIRRHAENLAVLGGAVSRRQWSNPVSMTEVLRSAIAEVEQYSRVRLVPPVDGRLRGHAVADVIHLLAELVENATLFSAPHTPVLLRANLVTSGLAVEVEDRGLGMPVDEQARMNALLADPDQVNVASLLADGRIGLFVVSQLARRHGITVRLQTNIYGGVQAVLVVPQGLLGPPPDASGAPAAPTPPHGTARVGQVPPTPTPTPAPGQRAPAVSPGGQGRALGAAHGAGTATGGPGTTTGGPGTGAGAPADSRPQFRTEPRDDTPAGAPGGSRPVPRSGSPAGQRPGPQGIAAEPPAGRRRHAQQETVRAAAPAHDGGPPPLPVRGAHAARPTPTEATPGIRPDERRTVADDTAAAPAPRGGGTVRGTMGKPQLPRRRAQEHIAPQLRGGPAPRQDNDTLVGHDPGLMAAFQRGVGLAEAQQHLESAQMEPPHAGSAHMGPADMGSADMGAGQAGSAHVESAHVRSAQPETRRREPLPTEPSPTEPPPTEPTRTAPTQEPPDKEPFPMDAAPVNAQALRPAHRDAPPMTEAHPHAPGADPTVRPDGSAPAG